MTTLQIELPDKLVPVFEGDADYRGAYGGRGSAKTRSFALMAALRGALAAQSGQSGLVVCAREYMNSLAESSFAEIKAAILSNKWLSEAYTIGDKFIRTKCKRVEFAFIGLRHNLDSIKSKARILILWVDEAEPVSQTAWEKADPTVREEGAEIWVTWNPERKNSATDKWFRKNPPPNSKIIEMNWRDNPWFPDTLDRKRRRYKKDFPEQYGHIWEGEYKQVYEGAYYASSLTKAAEENRIGHVAADPLMDIRSYHDIGGSGATADAYTIWVCQFVGREIRVLNYYESVGQTLDFHVNWMRDNGYADTRVYLPHDGVNANSVTGKRYADHWEDAGFNVETIPNQGKGAAMQRVQEARRLFPSIFFNETTTEDGRDALAAYHEKRDVDRNMGLGPNHDWSSHAADSFGLMCVHYEPPRSKPAGSLSGIGQGGAGGWMGN